MRTQPSVHRLQGKVQHYAWGGYQFIPQLLGIPENGQPHAEYWLGAHPAQPAEINVHGVLKKLNEWIGEEKETVLGGRVAGAFGSLPYLLKILDVRQMLSIQVHPDKASAAAAFEEENRKGIPLNAPNRNYKDVNHKPELMVALSDFWLLHGFKPEAQLIESLSANPDFDFLTAIFEKEGYKGLYKHVMTMPEADVNAVLQPLVDRLLPLYKNSELMKESEDFWAARAAQTYCKDGRLDRGIFSIYFFNLVHLKKGEGIYQPAGLPHAYLEGQNVEIMAASDNVLRAGLTDKHIDIDELVKHVRFEPTEAQILPDTSVQENVYNSNAAEFELSRIQLQEGEVFTLTSATAETLLVLEGAVILQADGIEITIKKGEAALITAGTSLEVRGTSAAQLFRATVPDVEKRATKSAPG
jgi:mannose-6-phosphate isomerase